MMYKSLESLDHVIVSKCIIFKLLFRIFLIYLNAGFYYFKLIVNFFFTYFMQNNLFDYVKYD